MKHKVILTSAQVVIYEPVVRWHWLARFLSWIWVHDMPELHEAFIVDPPRPALRVIQGGLVAAPSQREE
jgi:hypothetical protein